MNIQHLTFNAQHRRTDDPWKEKHWSLKISQPLRLVAWLSLFFAFTLAARAETNGLLTSWFSAQTNLQTWSADFTQTRTLKSLVQPLTATGHVWFAAPNRFRWELGRPPQTLAVRSAEEMLVIYPRLKRAERYPLTGRTTPQWRDLLALLDAGFPRDQGELEKQFQIAAQTRTNGVCELALQPRSSAARKLMPRMTLAFGTEDFSLRATELQFADGSTLRNDFTNAQVNVVIDPVVFTPMLDADYKITEPLKK